MGIRNQVSVTNRCNAVILLTVIMLCFGSTNRVVAQIKMSANTLANQATEIRLQKKVRFYFEDEPFQDVMQALSRDLGVNMILSLSAKEDLLTKDEIVTFALTEVPVTNALDLMLAEYNATYVIDNGVVVFISKDDADDPQLQRRKMFDCRKLIQAMPNPKSVPSGGGGLPGGFGKLGGKKGGGVFCLQPQQVDGNVNGDFSTTQNIPTPQQKPSPDQIFHSKCEHLQAVVINLTDPDSWYEMGGTGEAKFVDGILIVRHTEITLRQVQDLLIDLHAKLGLEMPEAKQLEMAAKKLREQNKVMPGKAPVAQESKTDTKPSQTSDRKSPEDDPFESSAPTSSDPNPFG